MNATGLRCCAILFSKTKNVEKKQNEENLKLNNSKFIKN